MLNKQPQYEKAWHFVCDDRVMRDGMLLEIGKWYRHEGEIVLCQSGYHASKNLLCALDYAPGAFVCRVEVSGEILRGDDKLVAKRRRAIWGYDATGLLLAFARRCALDVADLWDMPDICRRYLETGDESIRDAAWASIWAAACTTPSAQEASQAADWAIGLDAGAVWAAARHAADSASAARGGLADCVAMAAEKQKQSRWLTEAIEAGNPM